MSEMSAKVSDVYRQAKGRPFDGNSAKKASGSRFAPGKQVANDNGLSSQQERELLVFDLTNKWGPCHGAFRRDVSERCIGSKRRWTGPKPFCA